MFLSAAREKEFVPRHVRSQFTFAPDGIKVGDRTGLRQRPKGRAEHFSHCHQRGQGDEMRDQ